MANLVNLENVSLMRGTTLIFDNISAGIGEGEKIGVVGVNGGGKSTLLDIIAGDQESDSGRLVRKNGLTIAYARQSFYGEETATVRDVIAGDAPDYQWRSDPRVRTIIDGLGISPLIDSPVGDLSGGQRRRVSIAAALMCNPQLLLLDEPTNHLDIDAISWLAQYIVSLTTACVFVTHDRWFLDTVATRTWEVVNANINTFIGGYNDWIFARAERERTANVAEEKRVNLARKELAWLRRGAPARTSKPQYRIAQAEQLIAQVPPPRNQVELVTIAMRRLGKVVIECHQLTLGEKEKPLIKNLEWNLSPGARIGIVGANGSGKTTLLRALGGEYHAVSGIVKHGKTVHIGWLRQELEDIPQEYTVIEAIMNVAATVTIGDKEYSASQIAERLGFSPNMQRVRIQQLSGGQKRRLQLSRIMMDAPNVLLLDEPTNDLDIDTLQQLEDLLDMWTGTLVVISHDRFLLERVCDDIYALYGNGAVTHVPGGIEQYFHDRAAFASRSILPSPNGIGGDENSVERRVSYSSEIKDTAKDTYDKQKTLRRLEKQIEKLTVKKENLSQQMAEVADDHSALAHIHQQWDSVSAELEQCEEQWLALAEDM